MGCHFQFFIFNFFKGFYKTAFNLYYNSFPTPALPGSGSWV